MVAFPPCKINLGLHVINKRSDGYHNLETCFYPIPFTDVLEVIPADTLSFTYTGIEIPGKVEDNLCIKAYHLIKADHSIQPVKIHLHKIVPIGAGLGGGSSDAAYTLRLINQLFDLGISVEKLKFYAAQLGSDCSFFIENEPMLGRGRGEILTKVNVDLKGYFLLLVKPPLHVSTAEAYAGVTPELSSIDISEILQKHSVKRWKDLLKNDFEKSVFNKHKVVSDIKEELYNLGACYASMSGSGSTVFGLFENKIETSAFAEYFTWWGVL